MKKRLLYIDHAYHQKTKSSVFLSDLFTEAFEIDFWYIDVDRLEDLTVPATFRARSYELLIMFQVLLPRALLDQATFTRGIFVPMHDGGVFGSDPRLIEYRDFLFLNFSRKLQLQYRAAGLNSVYLKYYPAVQHGAGAGDPCKAFFWARTVQIPPDLILKLLQGTHVTSLHIHRSPDPHHAYLPPSPALLDGIRVTESTWFEDKADVLRIIEECAIYFAPRITEGIGQSFLDAMAMGRFVVAVDHPTMNEYVIHGVNGLLYDHTTPVRLAFPDIAEVQRNTLRMHAEGHEAWKARSAGFSEMALAREIRVPVRVVFDAEPLLAFKQNVPGAAGKVSPLVGLINALQERDELAVAFYGTLERKFEIARVLADILGHEEARIYSEDDFLGEVDAFITTNAGIPHRVEELGTIRLYRLNDVPAASTDGDERGYLRSLETWTDDLAARLLNELGGPLPGVTVVTVVRNLAGSGDFWRLRRLARSVRKQVHAGPVEHLIVDLGSEDGAIDFIRNVKVTAVLEATRQSPRPGIERDPVSGQGLPTSPREESGPPLESFGGIDAVGENGCVQKVLSMPAASRETAIRKALDAASGTYVIFLDHDSHLHDPYALTYAVRTLQRSNAAYCHGHARKTGRRNGQHEIRRAVEAGPSSEVPPRHRPWLARKEVWQSFPGAVWSHDTAATPDLAVQLSGHGFSGVLCDHVLVTTRDAMALKPDMPREAVRRITIVTTTKNNVASGMQQALRQNIESVRAQKVEGFAIEHLFIDGDSQDGTVEFLTDLAGDDPSFGLVSEPDAGIYDAMNKGIRKASGEIIVFLNSDDYFCSDTAILDSVAAIDRTGADFSYGWFREITRDGEVVRERTAEIGLFYWRMPFSHQTMFVKKTSLEAIGGFRDTMFRSAADFDMILRLLLGGARSVQVPKVMVHFRLGGMSSDEDRSHRECRKSLHDVLGQFWHFADEQEVEAYFHGTRIPLGLFLKIQKMVSEDVLLEMNEKYRNDFIHENGYLVYPNEAFSPYYTDVVTAGRNRAAKVAAFSGTAAAEADVPGPIPRSIAFRLARRLIPEGRFKQVMRRVYWKFLTVIDHAKP